MLGEGEIPAQTLISAPREGRRDSAGRGRLHQGREDGPVTRKNYVEDLDSLPSPRGTSRDGQVPRHQQRVSHDAPHPLHADDHVARLPGEVHLLPGPRGLGEQWRARSPENVIAEIDELVNKYGIREIHFDDDNITLDKARAMKPSR